MSQKSVASVVFSGVLWACSGGASDPLVESCSGRYRCQAGATSVETTLVKQSDGCFAGEIRLGSDHVATLPSGRQGSWAGSVERFDVCEGSDCVVCTAYEPSTPAYDASVHTARCVQGVDASFVNCGEFGVDIDTCNLYRCQIAHDGGGGTAFCSGTAAKCSAYSSEEECKARPDCSWGER